VWQGKVFDRERGELLNEVSPLGLRAVRARVSLEPSWLDGARCIVIDYSDTSLVAHWVRDEIRELEPGLYLGHAYWRRHRVLRFALRFAT
jgi:hypothetical protein